MRSNTPLETVLKALYEKTGREAKRSGSGYKACCPAHDDQNASLSVSEGDDGRALIHCHAGCAAEAVAAKLGLKMSDLMPSTNGSGPPQATNGKASKRSGIARGERQRFPTAEAAREYLEKRHGACAGKWAYHDADGNKVGEVLRWDTADGKTFRPISLVGGAWFIEAMAKPRPLYGLPAIASAERVILCEGERAANVARWLGFAATTSAGGANAAHLSDWGPLAGKTIFAWPDNDDAGAKYIDAAAGMLTNLPQPAVVRVLTVPDLPPAGDAVDWLAAQEHESQDTLRSMLEALMDEAPLWEPTEGDWQPVTVNMADVKPEPVRWLWRGRIALGKVTIVAGDPGLGKSLVTLYLVAHVTTGDPWPDGSGTAPVGGVVIVTAEDDLGDTVRPRLDALGANVDRVTALEGVELREKGKPPTLRSFDLENDLPRLREAMIRTPNCKLVVIDPVSAFLGAKTDSHKDANVRALLAPLSKLAAEFGVAVVVVSHLNKAEGRSAIQRMTGSLAFVAAARAAWLVVRDPANAKRRLLLPIKNNIGNDESGSAFYVSSEHSDNGQPVVEWTNDRITMTADEALTASRRTSGGALGKAVDWLSKMLANGPVAQADVLIAATNAGITEGTLDRAKKVLKVVSQKDKTFGKGGKWLWSLPGAEGQAADDSGEAPEGEQKAEGEQVSPLEDLRPLGAADAVAEVVAELAGDARNGTGRPVSDSGGLPVDWQLASGRQVALPASDRRACSPSRRRPRRSAAKCAAQSAAEGVRERWQRFATSNANRKNRREKREFTEFRR